MLFAYPLLEIQINDNYIYTKIFMQNSLGCLDQIKLNNSYMNLTSIISKVNQTIRTATQVLSVCLPDGLQQFLILFGLHTHIQRNVVLCEEVTSLALHGL